MSRRCNAKSKQSGERCKRYAAPGKTVCASHGGKTPRGMALPQTKHGRYSKDLPTRLLSRYEEAVSDPELLNLSAEIALTDAMTRDVMESLENADPDEDGEVTAHYHRLMNLTEQRRKLVETEQKRRVAMQNMITAESAATMVAALLDSVKRHVSDQRILAAIAADINQIFGESAG